MQSTVGAAPYNKLYRPQKDGIATTFAGFIAAALKIDPYHASPIKWPMIQRTHLLLRGERYATWGLRSLGVGLGRRPADLARFRC